MKKQFSIYLKVSGKKIIKYELKHMSCTNHDMVLKQIKVFLRCQKEVLEPSTPRGHYNIPNLEILVAGVRFFLNCFNLVWFNLIN